RHGNVPFASGPEGPVGNLGSGTRRLAHPFTQGSCQPRAEDVFSVKTSWYEIFGSPRRLDSLVSQPGQLSTGKGMSSGKERAASTPADGRLRLARQDLTRAERRRPRTEGRATRASGARLRAVRPGADMSCERRSRREPISAPPGLGRLAIAGATIAIVSRRSRPRLRRARRR